MKSRQNVLRHVQRPRPTRTSRRQGTPALRLEILEGRCVPAVIQWINPLSGDWTTASNWSGNRLPGNGDDVLVNNSAVTITLNGNTSVKSLNHTGRLILGSGSLTLKNSSTVKNLDVYSGTLSEKRTLTVTGTFNWLGGKLTGDGVVANRGAMKISGLLDKTLDDISLTNYASMSWDAGRILSRNQVTFTNQAGSTFVIRGGTTFEPSLSNRGTLLFAPLGLINFGSVTNAGGIKVQSGRFQVTSYAQQSGYLSLVGGEVHSALPLSFSGGSLSGSGLVVADVSLSNTAVIPTPGQSLQIIGDYTQNGGSLEVWYGGSGLQNSVPLVVLGNATVDGDLKLAAGSTPQNGMTYTTVSSGNVSGSYQNVESNVAGWTLKASYSPNDVTLLTRITAPETNQNSGGAANSNEGSLYSDNSVALVNSGQLNVGSVSTQVKSSGSASSLSTNAISATTSVAYSQGATSQARLDSSELLANHAFTSGAREGGSGDRVRLVSAELNDSLLSQSLVRVGGQNVTSNHTEKGASSRATDNTGGGDDLLVKFPLALPELDLPTDDDLLAGGGLGSVLPIGGLARAGIVQGSSSVSVVATVVSGEEGPVEGETPSNRPGDLADLLLMPLGLGDAPLLARLHRTTVSGRSYSKVQEEMAPRSHPQPTEGCLPWELCGALVSGALGILVLQERESRQSQGDEAASRRWPGSFPLRGGRLFGR